MRPYCYVLRSSTGGLRTVPARFGVSGGSAASCCPCGFDRATNHVTQWRPADISWTDGERAAALLRMWNTPGRWFERHMTHKERGKWKCPHFTGSAISRRSNGVAQLNVDSVNNYGTRNSKSSECTAALAINMNTNCIDFRQLTLICFRASVACIGKSQWEAVYTINKDENRTVKTTRKPATSWRANLQVNCGPSTDSFDNLSSHEICQRTGKQSGIASATNALLQ